MLLIFLKGIHFRYINHIIIRTDHSTNTTPVLNQLKAMESMVFAASEAIFFFYEVESNRYGNRYPHVCVHLQCIMHSDGSGDTSHTTSNLIDPIHCQFYRGTGACAHDEVGGYIQPSIMASPNGKSIYSTLRAILGYHCDAYNH